MTIENFKEISLSEEEKKNTSLIEHSSNYVVNKKIIESRDYNDKILKMVNGNIEDKRILYPSIKSILNHRSGTNGEDMIVYNLKSKEIYIIDKSNVPSKVEFDEKALKMIETDSQNVITIHNHPASMPPSIEDLNVLFERNQSKAFVVTHDGKIYNILPADFIAEGLDQTRGWFYTLLVLSASLFDMVPFTYFLTAGALVVVVSPTLPPAVI